MSNRWLCLIIVAVAVVGFSSLPGCGGGGGQADGGQGGDAIPDVRKIAFVSSGGIYVMNPDGTDRLLLTSHAMGDMDPFWSPDRQKIAFIRTRYGGNKEVYVVNADGTGITRLTNHPASDYWGGEHGSTGAPRSRQPWSPDGSKILFISDRDGNAEI